MANEMTLWWEGMAGPRMFLEKIATSLSEGKSVVLRLNGSLPWQSCMRDFLAHQLSSVQIDEATLGKSEQNGIIPQLLKQLRRSKAGSCPQDYRSQLSYLKEEQIFRECVVWLQLEPDCDPTPVMQFLSDSRGKGLSSNGCFVLEVPVSQSLPRLSGYVAVLDCEEVIRSDDTRLFSSILADGIRELPEVFRNYAARLAACLAGKNGELVPIVLRHLNADEDPAATWSRMEGEYGPYMVPHRTQPELEQLIWQAQLQTVFADIEMERLRITALWEDAITEALRTEAWDPRKNEVGFVKQFGEELKAASDAELGTLLHMMRLRRNADRGQRLLQIPDEKTQDWISFLCTCRNRLAHHTVCPPEEILSLLSRLSAPKA